MGRFNCVTKGVYIYFDDQTDHVESEDHYLQDLTYYLHCF